jgi:hypothetical protein
VQQFAFGSGIACPPFSLLHQTLQCVSLVTEPCTACDNGNLDAGEADVDCGGVCPPCAAGQACTVDTDCTPPLACSPLGSCARTLAAFCVREIHLV